MIALNHSKLLEWIELNLQTQAKIMKQNYNNQPRIKYFTKEEKNNQADNK